MTNAAKVVKALRDMDGDETYRHALRFYGATRALAEFVEAADRLSDWGWGHGTSSVDRGSWAADKAAYKAALARLVEVL